MEQEIEMDLPDGWYKHASFRGANVFFAIKNKKVILGIDTWGLSNNWPALPQSFSDDEIEWYLNNYRGMFNKFVNISFYEHLFSFYIPIDPAEEVKDDWENLLEMSND